MSMDWWRAHHGISNDSKLCVVALRSKSKKCEVGFVWVVLLDFASQNEDRGSIVGLDTEQISFMTDIPIEQVAEIIRQLTERQMIQPDGRLSAWSKRQPARERPDDNSIERVRRYRAKRDNVTPSNAQIRVDEIREEKNTHTQTVCVESPSVRAALPQLRKPNVTDLNGLTSQRFDEFWCRYPRQQHRDAACHQWLSVVTIEVEPALFGCLQRYLDSDEVARGAVANPEKWLLEQHRDGWAGNWPPARLGALQRQETPIQAAIRKAKEAKNGTH